MNHLNLRDRVTLQYYIENERFISLKQCAQLVQVNLSTIYRELKNRSLQQGSRQKQFMNQTPWVCQQLQRFPYVCNRCSKKLSCSKAIVLYDAYEADIQARKLRSSSRSKPKLTDNQMVLLDQLVSPLIQNRQSLYHVFQSVDAIPVSQSTLRRYIDKGYLAARNIDLPRTVRFPNKKQQSRKRKRININILKNRTYQDFLDYNHSQKRVVLQLDCVIGKLSDKKCILTLFEPQSRFQWGVLMYRTANAVNAYLSQLIKQLKTHQCLFFDCILVD